MSSCGVKQECAELWGHASRTQGLPWRISGKDTACQCRSPRFDPWVRKVPWRRKCQPTPVFLPGESPWTEKPGGLESVRVAKSQM